MARILRETLFIIVFVVIFIAVAGVIVFSVSQFYALQKAHSTFDNYYAFRGCVKLIDKTDTYGDCQLNSGEIIKLVEFRGKWYLNGDLPLCWRNFCL